MWWHADLRQDHKHMRSEKDQKTTTLGGILAKEIHKTTSKVLAGDDCNSTTRPLPGSRQDPCRGHQRGHSQARACQDSTAVPRQLLAQPAGQAPAWRRAASTPTQQAPVWRHATLHEGSTTVTTQQPANMAPRCLISSDACRGQVRQLLPLEHCVAFPLNRKGWCSKAT